jgi:hypothetical protein
MAFIRALDMLKTVTVSSSSCWKSIKLDRCPVLIWQIDREVWFREE